MDSIVNELHILRTSHESGFVHFINACSTEFIDRDLLYRSACRRGEDVFQTVIGNKEIQDKTRKQLICDADDQLRRNLNPIYILLEKLFTLLDPGAYTVSQESILASIPGGFDQDLHGDFDFRQEIAKFNFFVLVGLEQKSSIRIEQNIGGKTYDRIIDYSAGDFVICRGDLIHAGTAYTSRNVRLHYYIDYKSKNRQPTGRELNKTYTYSPSGAIKAYHYYAIGQRGASNLSTYRDLKTRKRIAMELLNYKKTQRRITLDIDHDYIKRK